MFYGDALGFLGLPGQSPKIEDGLALNLVHVTVAPPNLRDRNHLFSAVTVFGNQLNKSDKVVVVESVNDLSEAEKEGKLAVLLGLQNSPDSRPHHLLPEDHSFLIVLRGIGVKVVGLAYQEANSLGSGWLNAGAELTLSGRLFLDKCGSCGMIVDLSHSGHQTARDAVNSGVKVPMIASHGGCYSMYHHFRNLPDDVLRKIADRGGVVGIYLLTFGLWETGSDPDIVIRHIRHALNVCGEDALVFGSDAPYVNVIEEEAIRNFETLRDKIDPLGTQGARYPEYVLRGPWLTEEFAKILEGRYFHPRVVEKFIGLNFKRFLVENL